MKTKKKLIIPIAMLVLAVMAITSTTFAWFTTNSTVSATITNAKVVDDGTMLFIVDNAAYQTAYDAINWENVYQVAYDNEYNNGGLGSGGDTGEADQAGKKAVKDLNDSLLANADDWGFSTSMDYENSDLEMIDLTYTRDNDYTRYDINTGKDAYASALKALDNYTYMRAYNKDYHDVEEVDMTGQTSAIQMTGGTDAYAALAVIAGAPLAFDSNGISNVEVTGMTKNSIIAKGYVLEYDIAYIMEYYNQWQKAFAEYRAVDTTSTDDQVAIFVNAYTMNESLASAGNEQEYAAMTAAYKAIEDAAEEAADYSATEAAKLAVEATETASNQLWFETYNDEYGFVVINTGINTDNLRGTLAGGYEGAYGEKFQETLTKLVLDSDDPSTDYGTAVASANPRQIAAAAAAARAFAEVEATKEADLAVASNGTGNEGERATSTKISAAKTDAAYSHYGINKDLVDFEHNLYTKKIFNTDENRMVTEALAVANKDYIDITYTFWCAAPSDDTVTNKLALDIGYGEYITSYVNSLDKNVALKFNSSDLKYFMEQGQLDERVAEFYGTEITSTNSAELLPTGASDAYTTYGAVQAALDGASYAEGKAFKVNFGGGDKYYIYNVAGSYASNAANAARVMFSEINQTNGDAEIIGVWDPNPDSGYDAKTGGVRNQTLDVQDMYNKAQSGYASFSDLSPNDYVDRYNGNTDPMLLEVSDDFDIELLSFTPTVKDAEARFYRAQLNVKIWLEGFDSDCFNVIFSDVLDINFQFKAFAGI